MSKLVTTQDFIQRCCIGAWRSLRLLQSAISRFRITLGFVSVSAFAELRVIPFLRQGVRRFVPEEWLVRCQSLAAF